ncbi:hypothetical protein ATM97_06995 [Nocardia sp. MH4]|uniref:hypothetical protein n=1 Tax=Nocardia sp. MH4 TaxID=1768677 RepID=UPI001C4EA81E|nr:hypothetical protein [Nocardia sp. MH4]MBW0270760.1 hypothetical protein [Nocardia sp. MH4]
MNTETPSHITEVTTDKGVLVRVGQLYRDRRDDNVRTLRVDGFLGEGKFAKAVCTVIRQEYRGIVTEPMRTTAPSLTRITGREFVLVVDDRAHLASVLAAHTAETITATDEDDGLLIDCACGVEIYGEMSGEPGTQIGAVQVLMAAHIADAVAEATGQDGTR